MSFRVVGSMQPPRSVGSLRTSVADSVDTFIYPRRVLVIRAGARPRRYSCVLLNKRTASSLDHVLSSFASAVNIQSSYIKQLLGVTTGDRVIITHLPPSPPRVYGRGHKAMLLPVRPSVSLSRSLDGGRFARRRFRRFKRHSTLISLGRVQMQCYQSMHLDP